MSVPFPVTALCHYGVKAYSVALIKGVEVFSVVPQLLTQ
jgi:hypothetical protein